MKRMKSTFKNVVISMGLNDKNSKKQEIGLIDAYKIVSNLVAETFGAGTINQARGIFKHENGEIVEEETLVIRLYTDKDYYNFISQLKILFNQESIMVEIQSKPVIEFL